METARADLATEGVGYLDMKDYNRARWAYELSHPASPFMVWLKSAGYVRFDDKVRVSGSNTPTLPIPATKLAYVEILRVSNLIYESWPDGVESAAANKIGASHLLDLTREVGSAYNRWPERERPHRITSFACAGCDRLTLMYRPPREFEDEVRIDCWAADCDYVLSEEDWHKWIKELKKEHNVKD